MGMGAGEIVSIAPALPDAEATLVSESAVGRRLTPGNSTKKVHALHCMRARIPFQKLEKHRQAKALHPPTDTHATTLPHPHQPIDNT